MRALYSSILSLLLYFGLSSHAAEVNLDIWFVNDLIADLSQDSFAVRERATQRLIALGPAVLPELAQASDGARLDPETRERLERIEREAEVSHLLTLSAAVAEYDRLALELAETNPQEPVFARSRAHAERVLERITVLAAPAERDRALARLLSLTGARFFRSPFCDRHSATLRCAIDDLQLALSCFDRVLQRTPADPDMESAQRRTAGLLGSALWMESPRFE